MTTPSIGIAAIVKNEAPYLVEWIAHHRLLGIERFFIADNESTDGTTELLAALSEAGLVVHHRFAHTPGSKPQLPAYNMLLEQHRHDVDWIAFIDADEFIWPTGGQSNLPQFVKDFTTTYAQTGAIALNWATYGSSGHLLFQDDSVTSRFTKRGDINHPLNRNIKTLVKPETVATIPTSHNVDLVHGHEYRHTNGTARTWSTSLSPDPALAQCLSNTISWQHFRINHYVVKSYQEFIQKKKQRGRSFTNYELDNDFFLAHDLNTHHEEPNTEYLLKLHAEIIRVKELSSNYNHAIPAESLVASASSFLSTTRLPHRGYVDSVSIRNKGKNEIHIEGWIAPLIADRIEAIEIRLGGKNNPWQTAHSFRVTERIDVQKIHPEFPKDCGFAASLPIKNWSENQNLEIRAVTKHGFRTESIHFSPLIDRPMS